MKKILTLLFALVFGFILSMNYVFAQSDAFVGTWKFKLKEKIDVEKLIQRANEMGAQFKDDDIDFVYGITVLYVMARCEDSEMIVSDFGNTVLLSTKNLYDKSVIHEFWGKWEYVGDNLYRIVFEFGEEETYYYDFIEGTFTLADSKYQAKIITKLLANNLMLEKKGD